METIWVLENVIKHRSFYNRLRVLLLVASVCLWRKYHPKHKTVFYGDDMSLDMIRDLRIENLWDELRLLSYPEKINRKVFWSSPKTKIISETKIPILLVDHDFLIFKNIDEHLSSDLMFTYNEIANNWYPPKTDPFVQMLSTPINYVNNLAANVSLFYLPDPEFAREYGLQTLANHEEFTAMNHYMVTTNHMILSEQFMLRQWLTERNIPHKSLSKNLWDCLRVTYSDLEIENGIWTKEESLLNYKHFGVEEHRILEEQPGYSLSDTIDYLYRCIKASKLVDCDELKERINESYTRQLD